MKHLPDWRVPDLGWYTLPAHSPLRGRVRVNGCTGRADQRIVQLEWDAQEKGGAWVYDCWPTPWAMWEAIWRGARAVADETTQPMKVG